MKYIISMGSNLGASRTILKEAMATLEEKGCHIEKKSSLYRTPPWGKTDQPDFFNAVLLVDFRGTPEALMALLLWVEKQFGRTRDIHWGPRTLDLDILYGENIKIHSDFVTIPHPFFWDRLFVLVPLADIEENFVFHGQSVRERIEALGNASGIQKISWEDE